MKKNILFILIGLLLLCTVFAILYFSFIKSTTESKSATTINTLNSVKIIKISGNTIWVEQMATNTKVTTYKIEVAADTIISRTKNTNFFLPKTQTPEKLTFADLKTGYLATINTTPELTATSIEILGVSNTIAGNIVSLSDNTMKFNVYHLSDIKITDKNGNPIFKIKTYTVTITSDTELTSFNGVKEIPIKLSDIKAGDNAALLADQKTDIAKTNSFHAIKMIIIAPPPMPTSTFIIPPAAEITP